jgi:hypothetical protein
MQVATASEKLRRNGRTYLLLFMVSPCEKRVAVFSGSFEGMTVGSNAFGGAREA